MPTLFSRVDAPLPPRIRGLGPDLAAEADAAVEDGLRRDAPNTEEVIAAIGAIDRYLRGRGWRTDVRFDGSTVSWVAVPKRERPPMSEAHKAKLAAARAKVRKAS